MNEMYWLTVAGNLSIVFTVIAVITAVLFVFGFIGVMMMLAYDNEPEDFTVYKKLCKWVAFVSISSLLLASFTPSKKDLLFIVGVGGTYDYLKSNEKAKELPSKVIDALDLLIEDFNQVNEKDNE